MSEAIETSEPEPNDTILQEAFARHLGEGGTVEDVLYTAVKYHFENGGTLERTFPLLLAAHQAVFGGPVKDNVVPLQTQPADALGEAIDTYLAKRADDPGVAQPSRYISDVESYGGRWYAVLRNMNGVLAVYMVPSQGQPVELDDPAWWPEGLREFRE